MPIGEICKYVMGIRVFILFVSLYWWSFELTMGSLKFYRWFYLCMELCLQTKTKEDQKKSYYFKKKQVDAGNS